MDRRIVIGMLALLFAVCLSARIYLAFAQPNLQLQAYFTERQVEGILKTGLPVYEDGLSYSGKTQAFVPLYYYILAFFSLFMPFETTAKIIPNIFSAFIVLFSFILAKRVTNNDAASLLTAFISSFIPVFFVETFNSASPFSLVIPLMIFQAYCFMEKKTAWFTALSFILPLIHFSSAVLPLSLMTFLTLSKIEKFSIDKQYAEMSMFSLATHLWVLLVFYKDAFLFHGFKIIFKNIPFSIIGQHFSRFSIIEGIYLIGIIPAIYGVFAAYEFLFKKRNFEGFVLLAFVFTPAILLWLALIEISQGMIFLGAFLSVIFSGHYHALTDFLKKTRFSHLKYYRHYFIISSITIFVLTSAVPAVVLSEQSKSLSAGEFEALAWINANAPKEAVVLAPIEYGDAVAAVAKRKNVMDTNYLLVKNINARYADFSKMFSSLYKTEVIRMINKYEASYLFVSGGDSGRFSDPCFKKVFSNNNTEVFKAECTLKE
jgi:hypothetical protein